jgi:hypothetical protein
MEILLGVLASASFLEKVSLLVVGAALTGIIVPVVKFRMDQTRFEQQKIFEAGLAREAELVKARAQFLRDLVDPVWQFQLLALQISYDSPSEEKYQAALASYDEQSWQHLKKIRALVGGARWFTSDSAYEALTEFVDGWLIHELDMTIQKRRRVHELDMTIQKRRRGDSANWSQFNRWLYAESRIRTDTLLVILASDFGLAPANVAQAASSRANQLETQDARSRPASAP